MLPLPELFLAPETFPFSRNNKQLVAQRSELTDQAVHVCRVTIGDSAAIAYFSPIRLRPQHYRCYLYQWAHPKQLVNVCVLIAPENQDLGRTVELQIQQSFAPHVPGIPVDSAEISIVLANATYNVATGLGDGYYPVFGSKTWPRAPTALLLDFKIWKTNEKLVLGEHQRFDEYGMVVDNKKA